jgi:hypothetical protein
MLSYLPDSSTRARVRDLVQTAQKLQRQQAWLLKKEYVVEAKPIRHDRWLRCGPRRSMA